MRITRVYADANGESHFDELDIPLVDGGRTRITLPEV